MLCSVTVLHELGMNMARKNLWKKAMEKLNIDLLIVYLVEDTVKEGHTGFSALQSLADPLIWTEVKCNAM